MMLPRGHSWILRLVRAAVPLGGEPWFRCWWAAAPVLG